jgi:hypothetical protein
MWGHLQAVELLVNSDADIELCDNEGKTAVSLYKMNLLNWTVLIHYIYRDFI